MLSRVESIGGFWARSSPGTEGLRLAGVVCAAVFAVGAAVSILYVRAPARGTVPEEAGARTAP